MPSQNRRAAGRRRAWGRGPVILRFESLEGRQLLTTTQPLPDLVGAVFATSHNLDWGDPFHAVGTILNQGNGPAKEEFNVGIYASTTPTPNAAAVPLGEITIPAGLGPNATSQFDQVFNLPPTAIPGYNAGNPIYVVLRVDPEKKVAETNDRNNQGVGVGNDTSPVTITPKQPSALVGSTLGVTPAQTTWGQTITVTAQIRNNAQGDAPATRARLVLSPSGLNPGTPYDYTVGYLNLPAVAAWQTINAVQQVKLPAAPPTSFATGSQFTLSMAQDADFVTDPLSPHLANQGMGLDMTPITINLDPNVDGSTAAAAAALPDLAPSNVVVPARTIFWGYAFQVSTTIQNLGQGASGPLNVRFLLTGEDGSLDRAIFLGETTLAGLDAGMSQEITRTLQLPNKLPSSVSVASAVLGRIAVVVDPDHTLDETLRTNDFAQSSPVTLRVLGTDGTSQVPTSPAVGTTLGAPRPAGTISTTTAGPAAATAPKPGTKAARAAAAEARAARRLQLQNPNRKLHRQAVPPKESLGTKIENRIKDLPDKFKEFWNDLFDDDNDDKKKIKKKAR